MRIPSLPTVVFHGLLRCQWNFVLRVEASERFWTGAPIFFPEYGNIPGWHLLGRTKMPCEYNKFLPKSGWNIASREKHCLSLQGESVDHLRDWYCTRWWNHLPKELRLEPQVRKNGSWTHCFYSQTWVIYVISSHLSIVETKWFDVSCDCSAVQSATASWRWIRVAFGSKFWCWSFVGLGPCSHQNVGQA